MKISLLLATAIAALASSVPSTSLAATAAYWRHEEGPAGGLIPDGPDTVLDSSGNGQHMQTFMSAEFPYTSATYSTSVSPLPLRSGLPNTLSLDFGANGGGPLPEGPEPNDDNYTSGKTIATQLFTAMTFELAFNMHSVGPGQYEALFGKDGKPLGDAEGEPDSPIPPLKIMIRGDDFPNGIANQLFVEWIDGDGDIHNLAAGETTAIDTWMHVAFTLSATDAELWVAGETGDYLLKDAISGDDFAGTSGEVLIFEPLGFTIGRGMYDNNVTDWSNALIDEVRVSDTILTPDNFLFATAAAGDADFDGDQDVDGADFLIWQQNQGRIGTGTLALGDANNDADVDGDDLAIWKDRYGQVAVGAVPEPSGCLLSIAAIAGCVIGRRRYIHANT
jgi:hypothetical protein